MWFTISKTLAKIAYKSQQYGLASSRAICEFSENIVSFRRDIVKFDKRQLLFKCPILF